MRRSPASCGPAGGADLVHGPAPEVAGIDEDIVLVNKGQMLAFPAAETHYSFDAWESPWRDATGVTEAERPASGK